MLVRRRERLRYGAYGQVPLWGTIQRTTVYDLYMQGYLVVVVPAAVVVLNVAVGTLVAAIQAVMRPVV